MIIRLIDLNFIRFDFARPAPKFRKISRHAKKSASDFVKNVASHPQADSAFLASRANGL